MLGLIILVGLQSGPLSPLTTAELTDLVSGSRLEWNPGPVSGEDYFHTGGGYLHSDRGQLPGKWWIDEGLLCFQVAYEGAERQCLLIARDRLDRFYAARSPGEMSEGRMAEVRFVPIDE